MSYYTGDRDNYSRGDYYTGDYYRGDPGLLSFVGRGLRTLASAAAGQLGLNIPPGRFKFGHSPSGTAVVQLPQRGIINIGAEGTPQTGLINVATATPPSDLLGPMPTMRGYHLNKSVYETRGGGTSRWPKELELHEKGTVLVRNRRMNVGNGRALRHALRRVIGFAHTVHRVRRASARLASAIGSHRRAAKGKKK